MKHGSSPSARPRAEGSNLMMSHWRSARLRDARAGISKWHHFNADHFEISTYFGRLFSPQLQPCKRTLTLTRKQSRLLALLIPLSVPPRIINQPPRRSHARGERRWATVSAAPQWPQQMISKVLTRSPHFFYRNVRPHIWVTQSPWPNGYHPCMSCLVDKAESCRVMAIARTRLDHDPRNTI